MWIYLGIHCVISCNDISPVQLHHSHFLYRSQIVKAQWSDWTKWVSTSYESYKNWKRNHNKTKPCAYITMYVLIKEWISTNWVECILQSYRMLMLIQ